MSAEYKAIERQIQRTRIATTGKRGHQKRLIKMRLASLKREMGVSSLRSSGEKRGASGAQ